MGNKLVIGIDPDSVKLATAEYVNGVLNDLQCRLLPELIERIWDAQQIGFDVFVSIEDVLANNFVYARNNKETKGAMAAVGLSIGRCQQSQAELMRWLDHINVPYSLHKPTKSNWHDNKALFEKVTGWQKQSNDDTRSASYFGYIEASKC